MQPPIDRSYILRRLVLDAMCDDYENIDQIILPHVSREARHFGLSVTREDVVEALAGLLADGLAKAYRLTVTPIQVLDEMPDVSEPNEFTDPYFYITPEGMKIHMADDFPWPDDEEADATAPVR